jgi:hypothetical protein
VFLFLNKWVPNSFPTSIAVSSALAKAWFRPRVLRFDGNDLYVRVLYGGRQSTDYFYRNDL